MLEGGIPEGSRVLYSMEPGVDGQLFMASTLNAAISEGKRCLVIVPYASTQAFLHDIAGMTGADPAAIAAGATFLDSTDRFRILKQAGTPGKALQIWQEEVKNRVESDSVDVIFAYLDLLYDDFGLDGAISILTQPMAKGQPTVILEHLNLDGGPGLDKFSDPHKIDLLISISSGFRYIPFFNYFTLVHASWLPLRQRSVPFITTEGKIIPYIPKIVVTGPSRSGKSTFILSASDYRESVDRSGMSTSPTTVAMDLGWIHWKSFDITLYGTPGEERFDPIIPQLVKNAMGVVLVIDATRPDQMERAKHLIRLSRADRLPLVVAANRTDLPDSLDEGAIRSGLDLRSDVPVYFISSVKKADVRHVIESMVDCITRFTF